MQAKKSNFRYVKSVVPCKNLLPQFVIWCLLHLVHLFVRSESALWEIKVNVCLLSKHTV